MLYITKDGGARMDIKNRIETDSTPSIWLAEQQNGMSHSNCKCSIVKLSLIQNDQTPSQYNAKITLFNILLNTRKFRSTSKYGVCVVPDVIGIKNILAEINDRANPHITSLKKILGNTKLLKQTSLVCLS